MVLLLIEGKFDLAADFLNQLEPVLQDQEQGAELMANCRRFFDQYQGGINFLQALANGKLNVCPPDDPDRNSYLISLSKQLNANLQHLVWQAEQIAKGDFRQKVSFLGEFSSAFNKMIEALREKNEMEERMQVQSEQSQKLNAEKDRFLSIIAHDLRNPLGGFMVLTEMMADDSQQFSPEQKKDLAITLSQSSRNIYNLLENLLEWSRMQRGQTVFNPQKLILSLVVAECVKLVTDSTRNKPMDVFIDIPSELEVFADKNMLQSVVRNLVSNAVKFTPQRGRVNVSAHQENNSRVIIEVKDTGIGMSAEILND